METLYFYCAVVGGSVLVLQTILLLFASGDADFDSDPDVDPGVDLHGVEHAGDVADAGDAFIKLLSLKTIVAFLTFFGLTGLACMQAELGTTSTLLASLGAGSIALYIVAWLMAALFKLSSEGNEDLRTAVGSRGKVYLVVPADHSGIGKVTVTVSGRQVVRKAATKGAEIPTGAVVNVVALSGDNILEVESVNQDQPANA